MLVRSQSNLLEGIVNCLDAAQSAQSCDWIWTIISVTFFFLTFSLKFFVTKMFAIYVLFLFKKPFMEKMKIKLSGQRSFVQGLVRSFFWISCKRLVLYTRLSCRQLSCRQLIQRSFLWGRFNQKYQRDKTVISNHFVSYKLCANEKTTHANKLKYPIF